METSIPNGTQSQQVRITLSSQHDDLQLSDHAGPILVPTSLHRTDLSTLVNELLETSSRIPFEFFISGLPLRTSLTDFLTSHGTSTEDVLPIEYARAQLPPKFESSFVHDDVIGDVDVLSASSAGGTVVRGGERILSANYDGAVRIWSREGTCLATSEGAGPPDEMGNRRLGDGRVPMLLCGKFVSEKRVVASGWRGYIRCWDYEDGEGGEGKRRGLTPALDLYGHRSAVNNLAVHEERMLSASSDGTAMVWSTDVKDAPEANPALLPSPPAPNKRRKLTSQTPTRGPLATLNAHTSKVTGITFHPHDPSAAYTSSTDSTVKTWDLETAAPVQSKNAGGPHTPHRCLYALSPLNLIATGTADRRVVLMDPREDARSHSVGTLMGHKNAVVSLDGEPGGEYGICSGSWDGCVRVWDVRVATDAVAERKGSTYKIPRTGKGGKCDQIAGGEGVRVNSVRWDAEVGIVSAGADGRVQVDRVGRGG